MWNIQIRLRKAMYVCEINNNNNVLIFDGFLVDKLE